MGYIVYLIGIHIYPMSRSAQPLRFPPPEVLCHLQAAELYRIIYAALSKSAIIKKYFYENTCFPAFGISIGAFNPQLLK